MLEISQIYEVYKGEIDLSYTARLIYSTDASVYREVPIGVAYPKNDDEIHQLVSLANEQNIALIPRGAGTSLAGQVVGKGLIVDFSKYYNKILEINQSEKYVIVQPGIVLDELNFYLKPYNLFFAPETSTSNRCTICGMIGNNSCGSHSLIYKTTREHLLSLKGFLSDGSYVEIKPLENDELQYKLKIQNLEGNIYQYIYSLLSNDENRKIIQENYPDYRLHRRNMGYALDILAKQRPFEKDSLESFNLSKLIAGSEGTLMIVTEAKLNLVALPPKYACLVCVHFDEFYQTFDANLIALSHNPASVELIDNTIIRLARLNKEQEQNSFFVYGEPVTMLIVEFVEPTEELMLQKANALIKHLQKEKLGYAYPIVIGKDISKVWALRKAGLGLLSLMEGERKPVTVIEDTAVHPEYLKEYSKEMINLFKKYSLDCVFYAHIGTGEIHFKPALNLKSKSDLIIFRKIAEETASIVKKYKGSLSGEHGDGRLRGEFIPFMLGIQVYSWLKELKNTFDPKNIFNPNKIVDAPPMDTSLRYYEGYKIFSDKTWFNYYPDVSFQASIEKCNGSADCRKSEIIGGTMCPTYMATHNEKYSTRARSNLLREILSTNDKPFNSKELYDILDLCISCKACKTECPSNIDMAKFKAEFLQKYYENNKITLRNYTIAHIAKFYKIASNASFVYNFFVKNKYSSALIKRFIGFAAERNLPQLANKTLTSYYKQYKKIRPNNSSTQNEVYIFNDEFTNYIDANIGIKTIKFLEKCGYNVILLPFLESCRTYISKGLLKKAKDIAEKNIELISNNLPPYANLIGIEPSAILTIRDEYPDLVSEKYKPLIKQIIHQTLTIEEFILQEYKKGTISKDMFKETSVEVYVHVHCQFKAISDKKVVFECLKIPKNTTLHEIASTCCGMAGSFGYEKEHYDLSMKIGELFLFKTIRQLDSKAIIVANGTSCRQQIKDGTDRKAIHPIEFLYSMLI